MARVEALALPGALAAAGFSLRPVAEGDFPFLRHLFRTLRWEEFGPTLWPDEAKVAFLDQQFDFQQRHYATGFADAEFYLVERDAKPIGRFYVDRDSRNWYLIEISLLPDWRGRGLGSALIGVLQDGVRVGRGDRISLNVETTNPARRLYARLGFVEVAPPDEFPRLSLEMRWSVEASCPN
jgi:ribosomal protein S18 acetylase RimI-like enzyme